MCLASSSHVVRNGTRLGSEVHFDPLSPMFQILYIIRSELGWKQSLTLSFVNETIGMKRKGRRLPCRITGTWGYSGRACVRFERSTSTETRSGGWWTDASGAWNLLSWRPVFSSRNKILARPNL